MRFVLLYSILALLPSYFAVTGSAQSVDKGYTPVSQACEPDNKSPIDYSTVNFFDKNQVLAARLEVLDRTSSDLEKTNIIALIYNRAQHLFETPKDFIELLESKHKAVRAANDKFLNNKLDIFFSKNPTIDDMLQLEKACHGIYMSIKIKKRGLPLLKNPADFLQLVAISSYNTIEYVHKSYKIAVTDFIVENLLLFKNLEPSIDEVCNLKKYLAHIGVSSEKIKSTRADLIDQFISYFEGADLLRLLVKEKDGATGKKQNLKSLDAVCKKYNHVHDIMMASLPLVHHSADYAMFISYTIGVDPEQDYENAVLWFIRDSLEYFYKLKPTIDVIMSVHQIILDKEATEERKISTIMKLKGIFIDDFTGTDLIRLLDYGVEHPSNIYVRQLKAFKEMKGILF